MSKPQNFSTLNQIISKKYIILIFKIRFFIQQNYKIIQKSLFQNIQKHFERKPRNMLYMRHFSSKALFCFIVFILITVQQDPSPVKQPIQLDKVYTINLEKNQTKYYSVKIQNLQKEQSLFVQADSPYYDPYQIPRVVVTSQNDFQRICTQQNNQYVGICEIQNQNLKQNQVFDIQINCPQKCSLNLEVNLDKQFQIQLGQKIQINQVSKIANIQQFKIKVPQDANFTDIMLITNVLNQNQATQGISMYVNVGDQNVNLPSSEDYQFSGVKVWGDGTGVFIGKDQIKPGQWIKVLLVIGQGIKLQFYSQVSTGNTKTILLNTAYNEFNSQDQTKVFILNLTDLTANVGNQSVDSLEHKTIEIVFVIYSGSPQIRVGFDAEYINSLSNYDIEGTISYLITPQIRKKNNFKGLIYIEVSGFWASDYYISTFTVSDKFYKLADGIAQIVAVEPGQVQNFIYQAYLVLSDTDNISKKLEQQIQSFRVRISLVSGNAQIGIRRCISMQKDNSLDCLITDKTVFQTDNATKKSFDQIDITVRKDYSAYELYFDYNASQCQLYKQLANLTIYNCQFQIVVFSTTPQKKNQQLVYTLTMYQNRQEATLKEGYIYKDFIYEATYHYYDFTLPSLENVEEVTFYITILSGDAQMMGTLNQTWKYMEFKDTFQQKDIYTSFFNTLTFQKSKLTNKTFYLAIYAYEASDITLSLVVKRSSQNNQTSNDTSSKNGSSVNNKTQSSTLFLSQGLSQKYTLHQGDTDINFGFTSRQKNNISVQLIEIQGSVNFHIHKDGSTDQIPCMNTASAGQLKCTFPVQENQKYLINVKAVNQNQVQTFSISYFYPSTCKKYILNLPQFVYLEVNQTQCSTFSITDRKKNLQILTSFSTLDLLATTVNFSLTFNDQHPIQFSGRNKVISADQLQDFCKSDTMDNCNLKISIHGDPNFYVQFYYVVEQEGKQMAMFDGIVRKVIDQKMSQKKGKFFYYEVSSMKQSIKIFTTNRDKVGYYIGAKFVDEQKFISSPDSLYLPFRNLGQTGIQKQQNVYETRLLARKGTSVIQIYAEEFKKYCNSCVMLISIYGLEQQSNEANIFQLEVTQQQSFIYLGQQKTGFLSQDQIYTYDIYGNPNAQGILTIRDYNKESGKQKQCFIASVLQTQTQKMHQVKAGNAIIQKSTSSYKVFIQNTQDSICTYQISYSALTHSITVLDSFMPTQIKLQNSQTQYYLYNHLEYSNFQILNYVKSGDLKIAVNRVSQQATIQNLINKNIDLFDYTSNSGDSFLQINDQNDKRFCKNCYYLIAVKGDPSVQSQMAIALGNQTIGLTTYGILKQTIKKGQKLNYSFYSIIDFHVVLPLLFGQIKLTIKGPDGKVVYQNSLKMSTQIFVSKPATAQGQYIDYYDEKSRFSIEIQAIKDSSYFISVKRKNVSMKIYEGIPINIQIKQSQSTTIEFVNVNNKDNVSVLLQVDDQFIQQDDEFWLNVTAEIIRDGKTDTEKLQLINSKQSQSSFNFVFKSIKGSYFLTFRAQRTIKSSILLSKQKLTHLLSSANNLFMEKGSFQIYTPGQNIMIVVDSCLSQVEVKASSKYTGIAQVNQKPVEQPSNTPTSVVLQHANYGGHYIITAQNVQGQYFVKVNPKNPSDNILYVLSYYYYNREDPMPYKRVDINPQITYQLTDDKIIFILDPARLVPSTSSNAQALTIKPTYTLYLSNSSDVVTMNSRCDSINGFRLSQTPSKPSKEPIRFAVDFKTIQNQVGSSPVYYVSAKVSVNFGDQQIDSDYPPYIDLAYSKFQMTKQTTRVQFKSQTTSKIKYILLWIVIPVLISSILFVLALKFCIKKYKQLYPDQLVEEDREMGQSQGQMKQESKSQKVSDSLTGT